MLIADTMTGLKAHFRRKYGLRDARGHTLTSIQPQGVKKSTKGGKASKRKLEQEEEEEEDDEEEESGGCGGGKRPSGPGSDEPGPDEGNGGAAGFASNVAVWSREFVSGLFSSG